MSIDKFYNSNKVIYFQVVNFENVTAADHPNTTITNHKTDDLIPVLLIHKLYSNKIKEKQKLTTNRPVRQTLHRKFYTKTFILYVKNII